MNQLNRQLAPDIETVYVMASPQVSFVSSSGVKEIASFGGNVEELVPATVARRLEGALPGRSRRGAAVRPGVILFRRWTYSYSSTSSTTSCTTPRPFRSPTRCGSTARRSTTSSTRCARRSPRRSSRPAGSSRNGRRCSAEAKREQDRLLGEAREQAVREASQTEIVKLAERQAQEIIDEAGDRRARCGSRWRTGPTGCSPRSRSNLDRFLTAVRRGRERLHERSQETVVAGIGPVDLSEDGSAY